MYVCVSGGGGKKNSPLVSVVQPLIFFASVPFVLQVRLLGDGAISKVSRDGNASMSSTGWDFFISIC